MIIDRGTYFSVALPDGRAADVNIMFGGIARLQIAPSVDDFRSYDDTW